MWRRTLWGSVALRLDWTLGHSCSSSPGPSWWEPQRHGSPSNFGYLFSVRFAGSCEEKSRWDPNELKMKLNLKHKKYHVRLTSPVVSKTRNNLFRKHNLSKKSYFEHIYSTKENPIVLIGYAKSIFFKNKLSEIMLLVCIKYFTKNDKGWPTLETEVEHFF